MTFKISKILNLNSFPSHPFNNLVINFLDELSKKLIKSYEARKFNDLVTFGFWIRKNNLLKYKEYLPSSISKMKFGVGLVFHITPSNVPMNFAYSFTFGLLTGNSNIVRIPSNDFPQVKIFKKIFTKLIKKTKYKNLDKSNLLIKYKKEKIDVTEEISKISDARMIWGGDNTINEIKKINSKINCRDIVFSDKFSLSIINLDDLKKNLKSINRIAENYYNDLFFMDQNACTSPHLLLWYSKKIIKNKALIKLFWEKVSEIALKKYKLQHKDSIKKLHEVFEDTNKDKSISAINNFRGMLTVVTINKIKKDLEIYTKNFGYIYEGNYTIKSVKEILTNRKIQTISYYGFDLNFFNDLFKNNKIRGVDRIVPIGQSHNIDFFWDGYNLAEHLTRTIDLK
tara:strand:- start:638 stop:1828 length:1191 start_codon:yes stop_codon:yes gene_type:complete